MKVTRRAGLGAVAATAVMGIGRRGRAQQPVIRIGVLTDLSGPYQDITGPNSVACARQAAAEFMASNPGFRVEVIAADHRNKPDVGVSLARMVRSRRCGHGDRPHEFRGRACLQ